MEFGGRCNRSRNVVPNASGAMRGCKCSDSIADFGTLIVVDEGISKSTLNVLRSFRLVASSVSERNRAPVSQPSTGIPRTTQHNAPAVSTR